MHRRFLILAGLLGFLGVLAGTFGAHGLKGRIEPAMIETFEVGVRYHLVHAVALLVVALMAQQKISACMKVAGWGFTIGIIIFSGTLYLLAVTGMKWLGAITPLGGVGFMVGWIALLVAGVREKKKDNGQ